ncbi:hypothetical protein Ait01nite_006650 [Actinoplanes italicus]|uniref:Gasdermin bGSDM n=1 Tax=Actinoplanes italicus TaxID=113567 RepID=A0A2T0KLZ4_9ACTN|nr:hypothetical protein [Actinoplanes italicus]PRX24651.1 hypothetical protein CLV67_102429 [Actinoplanes italicus]GIE27620.1 hypothetical protein Ait01nite_006650 [Actinoplanes italicus]
MLSKAATRLLRVEDRDYVPLALPTTDLRLFDVLARAGRVLRRYSRLDEVLTVEPATPPVSVTDDEPVVATSGSGQGTAKLGIGLAAVSAVLEAFGGKGDFTIKTEKANRIRYAYTDVTADRVDLVSLDAWLNHADMRTDVRRVADLLAAQRLYVVVATLKARSLKVSFLDENSAAAEIDVAAVQDIAGGNITVSGDRKRTSELVFTGARPLTVAAKAAQLSIDDHGIWVNERYGGFGEIRGLGDGRVFFEHDVLHLA